ncbi:MAG: FlgD immunoglobulin-like domain containing protein [Candidatus Limnocylindrales bacterium]
MLASVLGAGVFAAARPSPIQAASPSVAGLQATPKAVIIVGPAGNDQMWDGEGYGQATDVFLAEGARIAQQARDAGMSVTTVFHPHATWGAVLDSVTDANLVVYLGHGNGWPSPYAPFQENTKDGWGLNPVDGASRTDTKYYGASKIRASVRLAPGAVVLLHRSCYTAGNGEPGSNLIPSRSVAIERVDNFASGFLDEAVGAKVVFAYRTRQKANFPAQLMTSGQTMLQIFKTSSGNGANVLDGYTGLDDVWYDSVRHPGLRGLLDHNTTAGTGYNRAITGELGLTTDEWLGNAPAPDTDPPELTSLTASASGFVVPSGDEPLAAFSPNGDGIDDSVSLKHRVSEPSDVSFAVTDAVGTEVRRFHRYTDGDGTAAWDGRDSAGVQVADGPYHVTAVATDDAGNRSETQAVDLQVLTMLSRPIWSPAAIDVEAVSDGVASNSVFGVDVARDAAVDLAIIDAAGVIVRSGGHQDALAGHLELGWDGTDDNGVSVAKGQYYADITATTAEGTVHYRAPIWNGPFRLKVSDSTPSRGQTITYDVTATEPLAGAPTLTFKWTDGSFVWTMATVSAGEGRYRASLTLTGGQAGPLKVTIRATDAGGQTEKYTKAFQLN